MKGSTKTIEPKVLMKTHVIHRTLLVSATLAAGLALLQPPARGQDKPPALTTAAAARKSEPQDQKRLESAEKAYHKASKAHAAAAAVEFSGYDLVIVQGTLIRGGAKEGKV